MPIAVGVRAEEPQNQVAIASSIDEVVLWLQTQKPAREVAANERLRFLLTDKALAGPLTTELKRHLADTRLSASTHRALAHAYEQARLNLLETDPRDWRLPKLAPNQIPKWLDEWLLPASSSAGRIRQRAAEQELQDALLRDDLVRHVRSELKISLERGLADEATDKAEELYEWTQPCLAAESWQDGELRSIQYLIVGQPQHPEGAPQVTLFDRADDRTAHCVSGNSLLPGNYPIGQAIRHPEIPGVFFHLTYLPTPRDRAKYNYALSQGTQAERRRRITEATLRRWMADRHCPTEDEVVLLFDTLDGEAQPGLVGEFLATVDDQAGEETSLYGFPYRSSCHARICFRLARQGKRAAVPGLVKAIESGKLQPPKPGGNPYHYGWIAALSIAVRDPWPGVDDWLAGLLHREERLFLPVDDRQIEVPTLGATAAAILAERNGWLPADLGLIRVELDHLNNAGCPGHRYAAPQARAAIICMWAREER